MARPAIFIYMPTAEEYFRDQGLPTFARVLSFDDNSVIYECDSVVIRNGYLSFDLLGRLFRPMVWEDTWENFLSQFRYDAFHEYETIVDRIYG